MRTFGYPLPPPGSTKREALATLPFCATFFSQSTRLPGNLETTVKLILAMAHSVRYNSGMAGKRPLSDQLRQAVLRCGKTRYRISMETGISESILSRFVNRGAGLSLANVDKLCECIGAELVLKAKGAKPTKKR